MTMTVDRGKKNSRQTKGPGKGNSVHLVWLTKHIGHFGTPGRRLSMVSSSLQGHYSSNSVANGREEFRETVGIIPGSRNGD